MAFMNTTAAYRIGLVMNVSRRHVRVKDNLIETGKTKVEDLGLQVIDPDDRLEMMLHSFDPFVAIKSPVSIFMFGDKDTPPNWARPAEMLVMPVV